MPELSPEMNAQILGDIKYDTAKIQELIQRIQQGGGMSYVHAGDVPKVEWRDLEELDYVASQLVKKIKYLRGDRY